MPSQAGQPLPNPLLLKFYLFMFQNLLFFLLKVENTLMKRDNEIIDLLIGKSASPIDKMDEAETNAFEAAVLLAIPFHFVPRIEMLLFFPSAVS